MKPPPHPQGGYEIPLDPLSQVFEDLRVRTLSLGILDAQAGTGWDSPGIVRPRLFVIKHGRARISIEPSSAEEMVLERGDVVLLTQSPRRERFELMTDGGWVGLEWEASGSNPDMLFNFLPPVLVLRGRTKAVVQWLRPALQLLEDEYRGDSPGRGATLGRLTEMVFFQVVRAAIAKEDEYSRGWLAGLKDQQIAVALKAVHLQPHVNWTVESLAAEAGMSRSVFASRFKSVVGEAPMTYVNRWRMHRATVLLADRRLSLKAIVRQSGYASEAAFRASFRRWFGSGPRALRQKTRSA